MAMINRLQIQGLRGIREARINGLSGLTILVGQNGAGKSTILDALLLAASPAPAHAAGRIVRRRPNLANGAPWLFWKASETETAMVAVNSGEVGNRVCAIRRREISELPFASLVSKRLSHVLEVQAWLESDDAKGDVSQWILTFDSSNHYESNALTQSNWTGSHVRLIDPAPGMDQPALHKVYSKAVTEGRSVWARRILRELITDFDNLEILTDDEGTPVLHVVYKDRSVPVELAGDGVQVLIRVCLELAGSGTSGNLVLLEEPEVHGHPGSLIAMSRAIVETVKRDAQVVLSTHSLDLMRFLIDESKKQDLLEHLSVFQIRLVDGAIVWSHLPGDDAELRMESIGDDLR